MRLIWIVTLAAMVSCVKEIHDAQSELALPYIKGMVQTIGGEMLEKSVKLQLYCTQESFRNNCTDVEEGIALEQDFNSLECYQEYLNCIGE